MSVSLPSDKLSETAVVSIFVESQPVTFFQVMSFLGKANYCANRHAQLCQLSCVIQINMLNVTLLLTYYFPLIFSFQFCINFGDLFSSN